jgi:NAD(P)-dependent dehydrogenase (short-subunit alcohol dehydrogenase family)
VRVEGKTAMVTGGGQGIGKAIAQELAREGANVIVADVNRESACEVAKGLNIGERAVGIHVDVRSEADIDRMVKHAVARFGGVDILINNAGISIMAPADEITISQWQAVLDINLTGTLLCCKAVMKVMSKMGHGKIINIASAAAHTAAPNMVAYNVSKAGVVHLTKTLAIEWAKHNINVNSVSPGITKGVMLDKLCQEDPVAFAARKRRIPLNRVNDPEDVAKVVVFLACEDSDNITGEDILIDGGTLAVHPGLVK